MLKIHNSPSSVRNASNQLAKDQNLDSVELACSIDISKIDTPNDIHEFDKDGLEAPFSIPDMPTEESHQLVTPTNKAFNRIITHSKAVEAHKGLRQEVLASTASSDNIPQNARLSSLMLSKQGPSAHNATDKILLTPNAARKSVQLTKSGETLIEKPKARGANKRHSEPIKISTLKLCRDIEKKQRIRDNKPYVDLGSSDDDSDEIMEKIYEVPYSPALEGAVILEKLPEEGEMDEIDLDGEDFDVNKRESSARRWNKFIIKSSASPVKEKYQPSFVVNPSEEEKSKNKTTQSQTQGKAISRDMIVIKKLFEKDSMTTERSATTTTQSYKIKLNTTPRQSPRTDVRIDQLMMLDSAWNGLNTRENETSSDEKLAAFLQEREAPKIVQRSQSLENLQGGRKIRQSIQTMRPIIAATTQSEDNSPFMNHHPRHGSVSNRTKDIEAALKILDVNFPYDAPNNGRMINIKELIEKNRPSTRIASAEKRRLNFDNIFQISPSVHSRKNAFPAPANKLTVTPRKERPAFRVVEGGESTPVKAQRSSSHKYLDGYFTKIKTNVVNKKELSIVRKDNGLARK